jgi:SAM-dependent methyltransferase
MSNHPANEGHEFHLADRGMPDEAERFWDNHYRQRDQPWSGNPNAFLVAAVAERPPGTALELGCGDGGDAIWLAGQGWRVTAADVSDVALRRAAERATAAGVGERVTFEQHDLAYTFPEGLFDLVGAFYLHSPLELPRAKVLQHAARVVAPDGLLLIVEHASVAPWSWNQEQRFPSPEETLASLELDLAAWEIERLAAPSREAIGPGGQIATVIDNIIAIRRLTAG